MLGNKLSYFQSVIYSSYSRSISCFCLTESWLSRFMMGRSFPLTTGFIVAIGAHTGRAVSDHIPSRRLATTSCLDAVIVVQLDPPLLLVACVYIPPACSGADGNGDLLLVGDFNSPDVNWCTLTASSLPSSMLCGTFFAKNLIQLVDEKTHALGNILDLISTNCIARISNISIVPNLISDHHLNQILCGYQSSSLSLS